MTSIVEWSTATLPDYISREMVISRTPIMPILELGGGAHAAKLLGAIIG